jgi:hypothetical protein
MNYAKRNFAAGRRTPAGSRRGVAGLLGWIKAAHPTAYVKLEQTRPDLVKAGAQLDGLGDVSSTVANITNTAGQIANAILPFIQLDAQRKLLKTQVQRAAQGLPPLEMSNLSLPAQRVEFDAGANVSTGVKYLLLGGAGIAVLWLLTRRR